MTSDNNQNRKKLRASLRQQRNTLDAETQLRHAFCIAQHISNSALFKRSKRIAAYLSSDGEIDPSFLIQHAWQTRKKIYLPILSPFRNKLYFAPYSHKCKMKLNCFQIPEPDVHPKFWLKPTQLDLILMPLVGFDTQGNRLGMGGGFYDRSLSFTRHRAIHYAPYLMGMAHQFQCVDQLPQQPHDVPLNMIATEQQLIKVI